MKSLALKKAFLGVAIIVSAIIAYQGWYSFSLNKHFAKQLGERENAIAKNPDFLLYKSLNQEVHIPELAIKGKIPAWLEGTLMRIGPGKFETAKQPINHAFDGFGMVHSFTLKDGRASYSNKFLQTSYYKNATKSGYISTGIGFDSDPCESIFSRVATLFANAVFGRTPNDNANVNIIKLADDFIAMTETVFAVKFDGAHLDTKGQFAFNKNVYGQTTTAHPHIDYQTNECINYITQFGRNSTYNIYSMDLTTTEQRLIASVPVKKPSYMHSFALTKNYVILTEIPLRVHPLKLAFLFKPFIENFVWEPEIGTVFTLVNRHNGALVGRYTTEAFFMFHHINAFEEDDKIMIDLVAYDDPQIIKNFILDQKLVSKSQQKLSFKPKRYALDLNNGSIKVQTLVQVNLEMPRINYERYNMMPYRFMYGMSGWEAEDTEHPLIKVDIRDGSITYWKEPHRIPCEPIFVSAPDAHEEDDGVLLSVVVDSQTKTSFLLVLDAHTMKEIARAEIPHHIPLQFHGNYFKNELKS